MYGHVANQRGNHCGRILISTSVKHLVDGRRGGWPLRTVLLGMEFLLTFVGAQVRMRKSEEGPSPFA